MVTEAIKRININKRCRCYKIKIEGTRRLKTTVKSAALEQIARRAIWEGVESTARNEWMIALHKRGWWKRQQCCLLRLLELTPQIRGCNASRTAVPHYKTRHHD
jgi:hypothetical protein